jgi:hypothetical protein
VDTELQRLVALFEAAASLVEKELLRALSRDAKFTARQKRERLTVISAILARLRSDAIGSAKDLGAAWDLIRAGYVEGSDRALSDLRKLGETPIGRDLSGIHLSAVQVLYESLTDALDEAITHVGRKANDVLRKATLHEVLVEQIAGRDRRGTATALEENLRSRGIEGFRDSRGRGWTLERYAKMAAATTAHEASTTATLNRLAENGIDLCKWVARPEMGRESPCDECKRLDGRIFSITGTTPGYPVLEEAPPKHPFCVCNLVPWIVGLSEAA